MTFHFPHPHTTASFTSKVLLDTSSNQRKNILHKIRSESFSNGQILYILMHRKYKKNFFLLFIIITLWSIWITKFFPIFP